MPKASPRSAQKKAPKRSKSAVEETDAQAAAAAAEAEADVEAELAAMDGAEVGKGSARATVEVGNDGRASASRSAAPSGTSGTGQTSAASGGPSGAPARVQGRAAPAQAEMVEPERIKPEPVLDIAALKPAPPLQVGGRRQTRMSLTAEFMTLAITDPWESGHEKLRAGKFGGAFIAAPLLELVLNGRLRVQRDRFQVVDGPELPRALEELADAVRELGDLPALDAMAKLGRRELPELLVPWKLRLAEAGVVALDKKHRIIQVIDPDAQGALENRLMRVLAGSGVVQAQDIMLLGLAQASRVLPRFVPASALAYNEKRIRNLLAGRDVMDYRVDAGMQGLQHLAVTTILENVPKLMGS